MCSGSYKAGRNKGHSDYYKLIYRNELPNPQDIWKLTKTEFQWSLTNKTVKIQQVFVGKYTIEINGIYVNPNLIPWIEAYANQVVRQYILRSINTSS